MFDGTLRVMALGSASLLLGWVCAPSTAAPPARLPEPITIQGIQYGAYAAPGGHGFFVDDKGTLVTAWHVMAPMSEAWVSIDGLGCFPIVSVLAGDEVADLLVVKVGIPTGLVSPFAVARRRPHAFEGLRVLTVAEKCDIRTTRVEFVSDTDTHIIPFYNVRGDIERGFSGSPVIDRDGFVQGLMSGGGAATVYDSDAIPAPKISRILDRAARSDGILYATWRSQSFGAFPDLFAQYTAQAVEMYSEERFGECVAYAKAGLRFNPGSFKLARYVERCLRDGTGGLSAATAWLSEHMDNHGENWFLLSMLGMDHLRAGRLDLAEAAFLRSIEKQPEPASYYWLASAQARSSKVGAAFDTLMESASMFPNHASTQAMLHSMAWKVGEFRAGDDAMRATVEIDSANPEALIRGGVYWAWRRNTEELAMIRHKLNDLGVGWAARLEQAIQADRSQRRRTPVTPDSFHPQQSPLRPTASDPRSSS